ncbi:MAG: lactate racemase domain-containing protein [Candidatus Neomarinimicrobiota bacterium]
MIVGSGSVKKILTIEQIFDICKEGFKKYKLNNKRLLFIIPDQTRTAPIDSMFKVVYELLAERVELLDFIIALGTHPPMSIEAIYNRVGISKKEHNKLYTKARFFNHHWKKPNQLRHIGTISKDEVSEISNGLMKEKVEITINKIVFNYDKLVIIGPTFPHEVVGFSGGNKYLFPGISGEEIINMFHWLGALITNPLIIGTKYTPVRKVIDKAATMLPIERMCLSLVVKGNDLAGLYIGNPEEAWEAASDLSKKIHITYKDQQFNTVLSCAPEMYDDLWTGGKCMYKLEPVVADGGKLIIYAPHINEISVTHGEIIEKIGYHVRDYFMKQPFRFKDIPGGIMAHSTHVRGIGTYDDGIEKPRINVILATGIPKETCEKINLQYQDPQKIKKEDFIDREDEGILYVPKAGEKLFRLKK